jgi:predicted N-acetyltransferase YhbS
MEIRLVKPEEFDELMDVMNESFGFTEEKDRFQHILPKYYYPENRTMVHVAAFEGGKMVSSVGIYPETFINGDKTIDAACIGAVSTLPAHRGKGYFTAVLTRAIEEARGMGVKLMFLGGDRLRYGRFGFECGGRALTAVISRRTRALLDPRPVEVFEITGGEDPEALEKILKEILDIYDRRPMRFRRRPEDVLKILRSWNSRVFYFRSEGKTAGYFAIHGKDVAETGYVCDIDTAFEAVLRVSDEAVLRLPADAYCPELLDRVNHYGVGADHMYNILDEEAVLEFLGGDAKTLSGLPSEKRARTRLILGDALTESVTGTNIFISGSDSG